MNRFITDIVENWINLIDLSQSITSITNEADGTSLVYAKKTWWAIENGYATIGGNRHLIKEISRNNYLRVVGSPVGTSYSLDVPFYTHGTINQTDVERQLLRNDSQQVTPMIYLYEPINERYNNSSNPIEREAELRIAVLSDYKLDQFTEDIYQYAISAMRELTEYFLMVVLKQVRDVDVFNIEYDIRNYAKHGVVIENGSEKNIFSENLSGVELNLNLKFKRSSIGYNCGVKIANAGFDYNNPDNNNNGGGDTDASGDIFIKDYKVADMDARGLLTGLNVGDRVFVEDATDDITVRLGWANYRVETANPITYIKIQEQESMDFTIGGLTNLPS